MTRTHGWESQRQQPLRYNLRTTGQNKKPLSQLFFGRDMIPPINHVADWTYINQRKQTQINKDVNRENTTRADQIYIVGDKLITKNNSAYRYKNLSRGPY